MRSQSSVSRFRADDLRRSCDSLRDRPRRRPLTSPDKKERPGRAARASVLRPVEASSTEVADPPATTSSGEDEVVEAEIGRFLTAHEDVDEEEIDTLGGLVFMLSGRVPTRGEVVAHPDGPEFEVIDADPRRIKRLRVRLPAAAG